MLYDISLPLAYNALLFVPTGFIHNRLLRIGLGTTPRDDPATESFRTPKRCVMRYKLSHATTKKRTFPARSRIVDSASVPHH
jgi:hypothetical protein